MTVTGQQKAFEKLSKFFWTSCTNRHAYIVAGTLYQSMCSTPCHTSSHIAPNGWNETILRLYMALINKENCLLLELS